jgi:hypothetical protein
VFARTAFAATLAYYSRSLPPRGELIGGLKLR